MMTGEGFEKLSADLNRLVDDKKFWEERGGDVGVVEFSLHELMTMLACALHCVKVDGMPDVPMPADVQDSVQYLIVRLAQLLVQAQHAPRLGDVVQAILQDAADEQARREAGPSGLH